MSLKLEMHVSKTFLNPEMVTKALNMAIADELDAVMKKVAAESRADAPDGSTSDSEWKSKDPGGLKRSIRGDAGVVDGEGVAGYLMVGDKDTSLSYVTFQELGTLKPNLTGEPVTPNFFMRKPFFSNQNNMVNAVKRGIIKWSRSFSELGKPK